MMLPRLGIGTGFLSSWEEIGRQNSEVNSELPSVDVLPNNHVNVKYAWEHVGSEA